jgi:hypothetical protein
MRRRDAALVALALLAGGAAGYAIGARPTGAQDAVPAGDEAAALRGRVADLEEEVARLEARPAPAAGLASSPTASTGSRSAPSPQPPTEPGEGTHPGVSAELLLGGAQEGAIRNGLQPLQWAPDPKTKELLSLAQRDPEAAARAARELWERGNAAERDTAVDVLARTGHRAFSPLLHEVLASTPTPVRARDLMRRAAAGKGADWTAIQMTGAPDVPIAGDHAGAWASLREDMGEVVIDLDYADAVRIDGVRIHETFNPGAVARVYARAPSGQWDLLWEGRAVADLLHRWFEPAVSTSYETTAIRLVLDTDRVPGWNEIDAVELLGDGRRQWASAATASSTFGTGQ